jgi:hypothetical protein
MATAEYDYNDFSESGTNEADKALLVKFYHKSRPDQTASLAEGRPCFKDVEYIEIRIPGQRTAQACRPATYADKQRFPRHYAAWVQRKEMPLEGTPLTEWPRVSRSQCDELEFFGIKTVEQLSTVSDAKMSSMKGLVTLKQQATDWLSSANSNETLKQENKDLKAQVEELAVQMAELLSNKTAKPAKKTGGFQEE